MGDDERPPFGYGAHGRGLWSVRDRDAEVIRSMLRREGYREFDDDHDGFAVEGADDSEDSLEPLWVTCTDERLLIAEVLERYSVLLRRAGYRVLVDPENDEVLRGRLQTQ